MYCTLGRTEIKMFPRSRTELYLQWMEGECIHGPHVVDIIYCLPVAFKSVLLILDFGSGINIFHRDPSFDRGCGIACKQC